MNPRYRIAREISGTIFCGTVLGAFAAIPGCAFVLIPALPIFVVWFCCGIYLCCVRPAYRATFLARLSVWAAMILVVMLCHLDHFIASRQAANKIAAEFLAYKAAHDRLPENWSDLGGSQTAEVRTSLTWYENYDAQPHLYYPGTLIFGERYDYDFDRQQWTFRGANHR